jgi:hypothetical protein
MPAQFRGRTDGVNRLNAFLGVMGYGGSNPGEAAAVEPGDLLTAEALGRRVAEYVHALDTKAAMPVPADDAFARTI